MIFRGDYRARFSKYIRIMAENRLSSRLKKNTRSPRIVLYHLTVQLLFLADILAVALMGSSTEQFYAAEIIRHRLASNLEHVKAMKDFWIYLEHGDLSHYLNGRGKQEMKRPSDAWAIIAGRNLVCGTFRLRQVRVSEISCEDAQLHGQQHCYPAYSADAEETMHVFRSPFKQHWRYQKSRNNKHRSITGRFAKYGNGGYIIDMNTTNEINSELIRRLKLSNWLDEATRAVFVEFTTYNPNINLFCSCVILFEFGPEGGTSAELKVETLKLSTYTLMSDYWALGFNLTLLIIVILNSGYQIQTLYIWGMKRFTSDLWNVSDCLMMIPAVYGVIAFTTLNMWRTHRVVNDLVSWTHGYFDVREEIFLYKRYTDCVGILTAYALLRTLKFFRHLTQTLKLLHTINTVLAQASGFIFMFATVFMSFVCWAHVIFGADLEEYSTMTKAAFTLFLFTMGGCNHGHFQVSQIWGLLFFIQFVCFIYLVLMNVFIAIVAEAYSAVCLEHSQDIDGLTHHSWYTNISNYVVMDMNHVLHYAQYLVLRSLIRIPRLGPLIRNSRRSEEVVKMINKLDLDNDKTITHEEALTGLRGLGYSDIDIRNLFKRYDVNEDMLLSLAEQEHLIFDMEEAKRKLKERKESSRLSKKDVQQLTSIIRSYMIESLVSREHGKQVEGRIKRLQGHVRRVRKKIALLETLIHEK